MCYYCHINLNNEDLLDFLNNTSENEFIILNLTFISYLILCCTGYNGLDIKNKALIKLLKYNKYYSINNYNNIINDLNNNNIKEGNKKELHDFCNKYQIY